jgi:hypothetical protein
MAGPSSHPRTLLVSEWLILALLAVSGEAVGNIGVEPSHGELVAELVGIKNVAISRETLTIDLRPLATKGLARVEVIYRLHNRGSEKKLDLMFASGAGGTSGFQVWLGDQPVPSARARAINLPPSWRAPKRTPGIHDDNGLEYLTYDAIPVAFTIVLPSGPQVLKVRYAAEAALCFNGHPTVCRQFAYVLAPARSWSEFGGLDVTIYLPESWLAACTPLLTREGDTLKGKFADLPADAIALSVQAPEGWAFKPQVYTSNALFLLTVLGGAFLCWRGGRSKGRSIARLERSHPSSIDQHAWPRSLGLAVLYGLAVTGTGMFAVFGQLWVLPAGQATDAMSELDVILLGFFLNLIAMPLGFLLAQLTAVIVRYRAASKPIRTPIPTASLD